MRPICNSNLAAKQRMKKEKARAMLGPRPGASSSLFSAATTSPIKTLLGLQLLGRKAAMLFALSPEGPHRVADGAGAGGWDAKEKTILYP